MNPPNGCLWLAKRCHGKNTWLEENDKQTSNFCKHQINKCEMHFFYLVFIDCHLSLAPCNSSPPRRKCDWSYSSVAKTPSRVFQGFGGSKLHGFHVGHLMGNIWKYMDVVLSCKMPWFFWKYLLWLSAWHIQQIHVSFLLALQKKVSKTIMLNVPILHNLCISGR